MNSKEVASDEAHETKDAMEDFNREFIEKEYRSVEVPKQRTEEEELEDEDILD